MCINNNLQSRDIQNLPKATIRINVLKVTQKQVLQIQKIINNQIMIALIMETKTAALPMSFAALDSSCLSREIRSIVASIAELTNSVISTRKTLPSNKVISTLSPPM